MKICFFCRRPRDIIGLCRGEPICEDCSDIHDVELTNMKAKILNYCIKEAAKGNKTIPLRDFSQAHEYEEDSVAAKVDQMYPALNSGVSPMVPWLWERKAVEDLYKRWGLEPPEEIEQCDFVDDNDN